MARPCSLKCQFEATSITDVIRGEADPQVGHLSDLHSEKLARRMRSCVLAEASSRSLLAPPRSILAGWNVLKDGGPRSVSRSGGDRGFWD